MSHLHRQHQITFTAFLLPGTSQPRSREALDAVGGASTSPLGPSAKPPVQSGFFASSSSGVHPTICRIIWESKPHLWAMNLGSLRTSSADRVLHAWLRATSSLLASTAATYALNT